MSIGSQSRYSACDLLFDIHDIIDGSVLCVTDDDLDITNDEYQLSYH